MQFNNAKKGTRSKKSKEKRLNQDDKEKGRQSKYAP